MSNRRVRNAGLAGLIAVALFVVFNWVLPQLPASSQSGKFESPLSAMVLGVIEGMTYGLLAVGLVLVYRTNRIINFAHGEIGAFGAATFGLLVGRWHIPYYLALPIAFLVAAGIAAVAEAAVVRRLRNAPRLMSIVATLGVAQFLVFFGAAINAQASAGFRFPTPPGVPDFNIGSLLLTKGNVGILFFGPVAVLGLILFLRRSRFGLAIRCSAANPEAARMAGIFAGRMSSLAWAIAGALSAFTAIMLVPARGFTSGESFGPELLLRAMTGAVIARMNSMPVALAAGIGIGIAEQLLLWNYPRSGFVEFTLFLVILGSLFFVKTVGGREEEKGSWAAVQGLKPLPDELRRLWTVRNLGWALAAVGTAVALVLPAFVTNSDAVALVGIMAFAIVGLSVALITGLGGQLSLGQFALAAIGATMSYHVSVRTGSFPLALVWAGVAAAGASLVIGLPALRIRGLMLTVTTLGFALMTPSWLLKQSWALDEGVNPGRPIVNGNALDRGLEYYYFALVVMLVMFLLVRNVRKGGFGRLLVAIRDNEDNARAFTVRGPLVKLQSFLVAGFVAGVGGAVYGHALSRIGSVSFPTKSSIDVVAMTVLGGMSVLAGPLIGAFYIIGIPAFVPLDSAGFAAASLGWLLLILYVPGGLAQLLQPLRDALARAIGRRHGVVVEKTEDRGEVATRPTAGSLASWARARTTEKVAMAGTTQLEAIELRKRFGGVSAVTDVSFTVAAGETLGLIGPNGAGKTTTFELLGGFQRLDRGRVVFEGQDVSHLSPEARGRLGLIRSFQDAALFPTMTVLDVARLAFERTAPTRFFRSALGLAGAERDKDRMARELVGAMGLDRYRDAQVQELSTGTRRITEIACLIALQPVLLLLDEPSSGIAQRETEALGGLLRDLKDALGLTLVVIEHDIPLIMGLSDRIVAMDAGRVIAVGSPEEVRTDPLVVEAYLGGSIDAIERSGTSGARRRPPAGPSTNGSGSERAAPVQESLRP